MKHLLTISIVGMLVLGLMIGLTGCLTPEYKEYYYTINDDGSGEGRMKFINLVSEEDEDEDDEKLGRCSFVVRDPRLSVTIECGKTLLQCGRTNS